MKFSFILFAAALWLSYASNAWALKGYVLAGDEWFNWSKVHLVNCENGQKKIVVDEAAWSACFNREGSKIAYYRKRGSKVCIRNVDGSGELEVATLNCSKGWEASVSWCDDGYLYMTNWTKNVYRVKVTGGTPEVAFISKGTIVAGSASRDGNRYAATVPGWSVASYDLANKREHNHGGGCQGSISSDGKWVSHNLDNHKTAYIKNFLSNSIAFTISSPSGEFNMHRFSQHSPKHLCFTCNTNQAYVCDVTTGMSTRIGSGAPYDYFPDELQMSGPTFTMHEYGIAVNMTTAKPSGQKIYGVFAVNGQYITNLSGQMQPGTIQIVFTPNSIQKRFAIAGEKMHKGGTNETAN